MKIKSDTDLHVSTTWGASIFLQAGEEREVGDDLGYQALQQGASEVRDEPKAAPIRLTPIISFFVLLSINIVLQNPNPFS